MKSCCQEKEPWQVNHARDAVRLFHFFAAAQAPADKNPMSPATTPWNELIEETTRGLRLEHFRLWLLSLFSLRPLRTELILHSSAFKHTALFPDLRDEWKSIRI